MSSKSHEAVTNHIINLIEECGELPWKKAWRGNGFVCPRSFHSKKEYNGMNMAILWMTQEIRSYKTVFWGTYKQFREAGAQVRKGEKGTPIVFASERENKDGETYWAVRHYTVFNLDQVDNMPTIEGVNDDQELNSNFRVIPADEFLDSVQESGKLPTIKHAGGRACYSYLEDQITVPEIGKFTDSGAYYKTLFHELIHSTGHKNRLNRNLEDRSSKERYSREELIAEMGAAITMAHIGLESKVDDDKNTAIYLKGWLEFLKDDKSALPAAAKEASKAFKFLTA